MTMTAIELALKNDLSRSGGCHTNPPFPSTYMPLPFTGYKHMLRDPGSPDARSRASTEPATIQQRLCYGIKELGTLAPGIISPSHTTGYQLV